MILLEINYFCFETCYQILFVLLLAGKTFKPKYIYLSILIRVRIKQCGLDTTWSENRAVWMSWMGEN